MAALEQFVAGLLHLIKAIVASAYIFEGWFYTRRWQFNFTSAVPACFCVVLIASLACMVGIGITLDAKVLAAIVASYSVFSHMLGSFS